MSNITSRISNIKRLSKGSKNEKEINEICDELNGEVKQVRTRGDPLVKMN